MIFQLHGPSPLGAGKLERFSQFQIMLACFLPPETPSVPLRLGIPLELCAICLFSMLSDPFIDLPVRLDKSN